MGDKTSVVMDKNLLDQISGNKSQFFRDAVQEKLERDSKNIIEKLEYDLKQINEKRKKLKSALKFEKLKLKS